MLETSGFTICIPTYNRADMLGQAIESALNQSFTNFELLIVDNNSSDNTAQIVAAYADERIRYFKNPRTVSMYANHNVCVEKARHDWIVFLHSDDRLLPDALQTYAAYLGKLKPSSVYIPTAGKAGREEIVWAGPESIPKLYFYKAVAPTGSLFNKEPLLRHPFNDELLAADLDFCLTLLANNYQLSLIPEMIVDIGKGSHQASFNWGKSGKFRKEIANCVSRAVRNDRVKAAFLEEVRNWPEKNRADFTKVLAYADEKEMLKEIYQRLSAREICRYIGRYKYMLFYLVFGRRVFKSLRVGD